MTNKVTKDIQKSIEFLSEHLCHLIEDWLIIYPVIQATVYISSPHPCIPIISQHILT